VTYILLPVVGCQAELADHGADGVLRGYRTVLPLRVGARHIGDPTLPYPVSGTRYPVPGVRTPPYMSPVTNA
jgi:hypothetical protein